MMKFTFRYIHKLYRCIIVFYKRDFISTYGSFAYNKIYQLVIIFPRKLLARFLIFYLDKGLNENSVQMTKNIKPIS